MPRDLSPALAALIASGHRRQYTTLDVTLRDGTQLHLSTGTVAVGQTVYQPVIDEVESLHLGLTPDDDGQAFKAANVDMTLGRTVTGQTNTLDGAVGVIGAVFVDEVTGDVYYDEKMPGEVLASEVTEKHLALDLVDEVYSVIIPGKTVAELFPFRTRTPPENRPVVPNDLDPPTRPGRGIDGDPETGDPRIGRYRLPIAIF